VVKQVGVVAGEQAPDWMAVGEGEDMIIFKSSDPLVFAHVRVAFVVSYFTAPIGMWHQEKDFQDARDTAEL
jgi:hypothetical protein